MGAIIVASVIAAVGSSFSAPSVLTAIFRCPYGPVGVGAGAGVVAGIGTGAGVVAGVGVGAGVAIGAMGGVGGGAGAAQPTTDNATSNATLTRILPCVEVLTTVPSSIM